MQYKINLKMDISSRYRGEVTAKQGDVGTRVLSVQLLDGAQPYVLESGVTARIYVAKPDGHFVYNDVAVSDAATGKLSVPLTAQTLAAAGLASCEIVLFGADETVLSTIPFSLRIIASVRNDQATPSGDEFTGFDAYVVQKMQEFEDVANDAIETVQEGVVQVQGSVATVSNLAQAAAGSADNAAVSANTASQALSDLLAMLGTDIATLTGGKLTPSQIPPLSINDVFEVSDASEITSLDAQRGDTAVVVTDDVVSDCYMLSADDASVMDNWVKLGVSYVANAGHAETAGTAENATMINSHRVVEMSEEQYASAVKDPDTYYLVH